jgi:hypothetical protein
LKEKETDPDDHRQQLRFAESVTVAVSRAPSARLAPIGA